MRRRGVAIVWLAGVWVALWGAITWANVLGGLVVAATVLVLVPLGPPGPPVAFRPHMAVRLTGYLLWRMVVASGEVAWEVIRPGRYISGIVALPIETATPEIMSLTCIAIGLTPGSMVIEVSETPPVLYVHVLRLSDLEETRAGLVRLEEMIEATLPPRGVPV